MAVDVLPPLGLYIHIPWCIRKCPYCDFNSHEVKGSLEENDYVDALLRDIDCDLSAVQGRMVETIFIGGGTPSLFSPDAMARLLEGVFQRVNCKPGLEVTMEANPGTAERDKFSAFRQAGINRLSIGVQSFQDAMLQRLGRVHSGKEAFSAIEMAQHVGFNNFNLDLMFGLPGQSVQQAEQDVEMALAFEPTHVSHYQLTIEPNTFFYRQPPTLPETDDCWEIQQRCHRLLGLKGYEQYEVSAWSRPGFGCQHNLNYWQFGDYLGIGAGAHGKITTQNSLIINRTWKTKHPKEYLAKAGTKEALTGRRLEPSELPLEFMMNALRLRGGFTRSLFEKRTGLPLKTIDEDLSQLYRRGLLQQRGDLIQCTEKGWDFLDELLQQFIKVSH